MERGRGCRFSPDGQRRKLLGTVSFTQLSWHSRHCCSDFQFLRYCFPLICHLCTNEKKLFPASAIVRLLDGSCSLRIFPFSAFSCNHRDPCLTLSFSKCRWCFPRLFWRSDLCWRCMQTLWHIRTCCWPSLREPHRRRESFASWSIISQLSMRAARGPWPRSPTTPSLARRFTAPGKFPRTVSSQRGLPPTLLTAIIMITLQKATN